MILVVLGIIMIIIGISLVIWAFSVAGNFDVENRYLITRGGGILGILLIIFGLIVIGLQSRIKPNYSR